MSKSAREKQLEAIEAEKARLNKKYGAGTGATASDPYKLNVIPTGILALDYATGIGGWPRGHFVEVYGVPDIGKSSVLGINMLREAQKLGLFTGIVATEPNIDEAWLRKHGVDTDLVLIARPDTAEEAVEVLWDWVNGGIIDAILFDSLAGMPLEKELADDAKKQAYGNSSLITFAVRRCLMRAYKNNIFVMFINQVRDKQAGQYTMLDAPGGHAKEHACNIRLQLKPGKNRYHIKVKQNEAVDDVMVGQEIIAKIVRNKLSEGTGHTARFDFFQKETDIYPFGVDRASDILNTAIMTGTVEETSPGIFVHHSFPAAKNGRNMIKGRKNVAKFFEDNPEIIDTLRTEVLGKMQEKVADRTTKKEAKEARLKVVNGGD